MAFSWDGAISAQTDSTGNPVLVRLTTQANPGETVILIAGNDSSSVTVSSITDDQSNTWDYEASPSSGSGNVLIAWSKITTAITTSDDIVINWSGTADTIARAYKCTGINGATDDGTSNDGYAEEDPQSISVNTPNGGVLFGAFLYPFDYGFIGDTWTYGTEFADMDSGTDMNLSAAYREVATGVRLISRDTSGAFARYAAGVVIPYADAFSYGQAIVVM